MLWDVLHLTSFVAGEGKTSVLILFHHPPALRPTEVRKLLALDTQTVFGIFCLKQCYLTMLLAVIPCKYLVHLFCMF